MANTKISALTAASALGGTEVLPVVQSAATVGATISQIKTFMLGANTFTGLQTVSAGIQASDGTKAAPSYSFTNSTGTGWYWRSGIAIGLAGNSGKEILQVGPSGSISFAGNAIGVRGGGGGDLSVAGADVYWTGPSAAIWQQGEANAASPVAQTLQAQGSRSGTDTNVGGADYTIQSGNGTGTGTISTLILRSPVAVGSGTGAQTMTTGLTIRAGTAVRPSYTVAALPAAATAGAGAMAWVTDANATTFLSTVAGGGANLVPVSSNGTNWVIG